MLKKDRVISKEINLIKSGNSKRLSKMELNCMRVIISHKDECLYIYMSEQIICGKEFGRIAYADLPEEFKIALYYNFSGGYFPTFNPPVTFFTFV